jgi:Rod binding domain-containing protein
VPSPAKSAGKDNGNRIDSDIDDVRKNEVRKDVKAARDFETLLLTPVLDSLQKTFAGIADDDKTPGASDYRRMGTEALTKSIVDGGGIGIARLILRHLQAPKVSGGNGTGV